MNLFRPNLMQMDNMLILLDLIPIEGSPKALELMIDNSNLVQQLYLVMVSLIYPSCTFFHQFP